MWFSDSAQLPEKLLDDLAEDKVVFFIGAGVSKKDKNRKKGLPDFQGLIRILKMKFGLPKNNRRRTMGDMEFFDEFEDQEQMRKEIKRIFDESGGHYNSKHADIYRIASARKRKAKIVTTNFDSYLEDAARDVNKESHFSDALDPKVWTGPAVPNGNRFHGIVHLHGQISENLEDLILGKKDFGSAYLVESWASRFLLQLFTNYTVIFIGYSNKDAHVEMFAKGLQAMRDRYVICLSHERGFFETLGMTPIVVADYEHALVNGLKHWAEIESDDMISQENTLLNLLKKNYSTLNPREVSIIKSMIKTPLGLDVFQKNAVFEEWFDWIIENFADGYIFNSICNESNRRIGERLFDWVADQTFENDENSRKVLEIVIKNQELITLNTINKLAYSFTNFNPQIENEILENWIDWFFLHLDREQNDLLAIGLYRLNFSNHGGTALKLWNYLSVPYFTTQVKQDENGKLKISSELTMSYHPLNINAFESFVERNRTLLTPVIAELVIKNYLLSIKNLEGNLFNHSDAPFKKFLFMEIWVPTFENLENELTSIPILQTKLMLNALEIMSVSNFEEYRVIISELLDSEIIFLNRVGLYSIFKNPKLHTKKTLKTIISRQMISKELVWYELILAISVILEKEKPDNILKNLIDAYSLILEEFQKESRAKSFLYSVISKIRDQHLLELLLTKISENGIDISDSYLVTPNVQSSGGFVDEGVILSIEDIRGMFENNPEKLAKDYSQSLNSGGLFKSSGAVNYLKSFYNVGVNDANLSAELLRLNEYSDNVDIAYINEIFAGLIGNKQFNNDQILQCIKAGVESWPHITKIQFIRLLIHWMNNNKSPIPESGFKLVSQVLKSELDQLSETDEKIFNNDFSFTHSNSISGVIADFFIMYEISVAITGQYELRKLESSLTSLHKYLKSESNLKEFVAFSFGMYINNLFYYFPNWVDSKLIPILNYRKEIEISSYVWRTVLYSKFPVSQSFSSKILIGYLEAIKDVKIDLQPKMRIIENLIVSMYYSRKTLDSSFLISLIESCKVSGNLDLLAKCYSRITMEVTGEVRETFWNETLKPYLVSRSTNIPKVEKSELFELTELILNTRDKFLEASELYSQANICFSPNIWFHTDSPITFLATNFPEELTLFVIRAIDSTFTQLDTFNEDALIKILKNGLDVNQILRVENALKHMRNRREI